MLYGNGGVERSLAVKSRFKLNRVRIRSIGVSGCSIDSVMIPTPPEVFDDPSYLLGRSWLESCLHADNLDVPVLPQIATEVMAMSQDPNADMGDLSELIHQDQSIAGRVLRIANSAAFAGSERIVSLQQAVARMGLELLSEIAVSIAIQGNVFQSPRYRAEMDQLWQHALVSALFAKEIARFLRKHVEGHYLCGLLHAIGKPMILKLLIQHEVNGAAALPREVVLALVEQYHQPFGVRVTTQWALPSVIRVVNEWYVDYARAPAFALETAVTYLASRLATFFFSPDAQSDRQLLYDPVFEVLNLYPQDRLLLLERREVVEQRLKSIQL
jgi:HD-like signal output (HDOD) protein